MKLYFHPMSRATRPRWLLEELGVPYELEVVDIWQGHGKRPEYLKVHPHGALPAFEDEGQTLIESSAICMYLADKFPEKNLAPRPGTPERGRYYQWMVYAVATGDPAVVGYFVHSGGRKGATPNPQLADEARTRWLDIARFLERSLDGREFLLDRFTAADVLIGSVVFFAERLGLNQGFPGLSAYAARLAARPAFQKARS